MNPQNNTIILTEYRRIICGHGGDDPGIAALIPAGVAGYSPVVEFG